MDINELSDQEKSVMLAKLCGWRAIYYDGKVKHSREVVHVADISYEHWMLRLTKGEYLPDYCKPQGIREAFPHVWFDHFSNEDEALKVICPNLYDPANMALLARVIEWAWENDVSYEKIDPENIHGSMCEAVDNILRAGMVGETS